MFSGYIKLLVKLKKYLIKMFKLYKDIVCLLFQPKQMFFLHKNPGQLKPKLTKTLPNWQFQFFVQYYAVTMIWHSWNSSYKQFIGLKCVAVQKSMTVM